MAISLAWEDIAMLDGYCQVPDNRPRWTLSAKEKAKLERQVDETFRPMLRKIAQEEGISEPRIKRWEEDFDAHYRSKTTSTLKH